MVWKSLGCRQCKLCSFIDVVESEGKSPRSCGEGDYIPGIVDAGDEHHKMIESEIESRVFDASMLSDVQVPSILLTF